MINRPKYRKISAVWLIAQGVLTALVPQLSVKIVKRMIGKNFENAGELEAKPAYLRQLRALGVGVAAAGVATLVLNRDTQQADTEEQAEDETVEEESA